MGNSSSNPALGQCLYAAVGSNADLLAFPNKPLYQVFDVKPYNLDIPITPAAVTYPETAQHVAAIVKCAVEADLKVQARSGGHSYGNYCIGGASGALVIDLKHLQTFSVDPTSQHATIGSGTLLADVTSRLLSANSRAMAHGVCGQVGIGGHATIGGLGPTSRMWGAALDHIVEAEVVLADSSIVRASATQNTDLFFAIKGAGASFGVVTEFVVRTEAAPPQSVLYAYSFRFGSHRSMAATFRAWQTRVADPSLPRLLASQVVVTALSLDISGAYFGPSEDFAALNLTSFFPSAPTLANVTASTAWPDAIAHWAEEEALRTAGGISSPFYAKSLAFTPDTLLSDAAIDDLFAYFDTAPSGTPLWFAVFDLSAGAVSDVAPHATAFAHRDALYYLQAYAVDIGGSVSATTRAFLQNMVSLIEGSMPNITLGAYPGYVDPALPDAQARYWGSNLEALGRIKKAIDPRDVFHNPQSVRPAVS